MEKMLYDEMVECVTRIDKEMCLSQKRVFVFGHCNATFELIDLLYSKGIKTAAILDNSEIKQGKTYNGVVVISPSQFVKMTKDLSDIQTVVLIASRFFSSMEQQLRELGFQGSILKVVEYNTYSMYSLSRQDIDKMLERERYGDEVLSKLLIKFENYFIVFCPFNALGDVYFMMSYWSAFAKARNITNVVFCVVSKVLTEVVHMFGDYYVEVYKQNDLDAMIQSVLYRKNINAFIAHQDRPYIIELTKALYVKMISLEKIYCCGVYGLPENTKPVVPNCNMYVYKGLDTIPEGKAVIFSPYAKSVIPIEPKVWEEAVAFYNKKGFKCYTNTVGDEKPLLGTDAISPSLLEMRSVVERAGTFVGIRSGLCDVIREAKAKKIALYPDYYYSDTRWRAIDIYKIEKFEYNLLATEEIKWENL